MLSHRSLKIYVDYGLPRLQAHVLQNFVFEHERQTSVEGDASLSRAPWLFIGRADEGKGLAALGANWPSNDRLELLGPSVELLKTHKIPNTWSNSGLLSANEVRRRLASAEGLVYPTQSWETFGLVVAEAFEAGVPVVARAGSAGADLVEEFQAGAIYGPGHMSLREALDYVSSNQETLRKRARAAYEQNFTKEIWLERIEKLYETVIAEHRNQSR